MDFATYFQNFPPELATFFIALLPISELRGAIPVGIGVFDLPWPQAYFWAVVGNMIPVFILVYALEPIVKFVLRHIKFLKSPVEKFLKRIREKNRDRVQKWGPFGLIFLVAIPLPITGAWTGAIVAWLFGLPKLKSILWIFLGVLIAGAIVTAISLGAISIF